MPVDAEPGLSTATVADAIVVGAGLTGLACAFELVERGLRVMVLEASRQAGGVVGTFETNGFLFEQGPNTVPASASHLRSLSDRLGIVDKMVTSRTEARRRYLFSNGGLHELPSGPGALLRTPLLSAKAKRRLASEPLRKYRGGVNDGPDEVSLEAFLTERVGREATRTLGGAFVRGVYAAEIDELGAASAFPRLVRMASEHGGLVRGMLARRRGAGSRSSLPPPPGPRTSGSDLLSYSGGFQVLIHAFERALAGRISTSTPVVEIDRGPGGWRAVLEGGESLACRELILAVPAPVAHPLVAMCAPERLDLDGLGNVEHAAVTSVHLGLEAAPLPPGFGFLVPPDEERKGDPRTPRVLGMLFVSNLFAGRAPSGTSSVTAMFRGGEVAALVGDQLVDRAVVELEKALIGYSAVQPQGRAHAGRPRVVASRIQRWTHVIPRYVPGHGARMRQLQDSAARMLPGLHLAGSYVGGVSVDDRLRAGLDVAARAAGRLEHLAELRRTPPSGHLDPLATSEEAS